jgi:S1-C subfamily serine protease
MRNPIAQLGGLLMLIGVTVSQAGPIEDAAKSVVLVRTPDGLGTGFVVHNRSLVATNFHVIDGAKEAKVEFQDGATSSVDGFFIASPGYDLAILQLSEPADVPPLRLSGTKPDLGAEVFTIGSPKGLAGSVSKGVVSAHRRWSDLKPLLGTLMQDFGYEPQSHWIQTDAAINSGNSGGPLVIETGEVVAVNTLASPATVGQNINFAVSVDHLVDFLDKLPARHMPLADLPRSTNKRDLPTEDDTLATLAYWTSMSKVLGTHLYQYQKLEVDAGRFELSAVPAQPDPVEQKDPKASVADSYESPFAHLRSGQERAELRAKLENAAMNGDEEAIAILRKADAAAAATRKAFRERGDAAAKRRQKERDADPRYQAWRSQMMLKGLPPEVIAALGQSSQTEKLCQEVEELLGNRAKIAGKAADNLEAIPVAGVNDAVVSFATDLTAALRRYSLACFRAQSACPLLRNRTPGPLFDEALANLDRTLQEVLDLRDVVGGELRTRLQNMYHKNFGPTVALSADQLVIFDGKRVEKPSQ